MSLLRKNDIKKGETTSNPEFTISFFFFLILAIVFTYLGIREYRDYMRYKDNVVPVEATIASINAYDDDGDTDYSVYVSYIYEGVAVTKVHWKNMDKKTFDPGDTVTLFIPPEKPDYIFEGKNGYVFFILAVIIFAFYLNSLTERLRSNKRREAFDASLITGEMLTDDLKPVFWIFVTKGFIFVALALLAGCFILPEVFRDESKFTGVILLLAGVLSFVISLINIKRIPQKGYEMFVDTCERKWEESRGEDETKYTYFKKLGKVVGHYGFTGKRYYVVTDNKKKLRKIYDVEIWQPAIEDETLSGCDTVVVNNLLVDIGIAAFLAVAYIGIICVTTRILL